MKTKGQGVKELEPKDFSEDFKKGKSSQQLQIPHYPEPDYSRPLLEIPFEAQERMMGRLRILYGDAVAEKYTPELERILKVHYAYKPQEMIDQEKEFDPQNRFTERDMILITYGDLLRGEAHSPLASLGEFVQHPGLRQFFNTLHILPFFPYSSDKGFSVTDFESVDPNLGSWQDIEEIGKRYELMFDGVLNHISSKSPAFQEFLNGNPHFKNIATAYTSHDALTPEQRGMIVRPRTSDILTKFRTIEGERYVWTTFSADQVDLNYKNPDVLMFIIETMLLYVRRGADILRLDAVTYLWSEPGTSSVHLEQTHEIIKLLRDVFDVVAPRTAILTETNVPHEKNVSYFGNGYDEARMVYNFALPPLVLHTFYREDATALSQWARDLTQASDSTTFLNMLDTHDGIGLMGVRDILSKEDIDFIIHNAREHGAFISYKTGNDGNEEPYELNCTWFSAINQDGSEEDVAFQVKRFVASRSIPMMLRGVPAIYFHGLIGTRNDIDAVLKTKSKRDINRKVIKEEALIRKLRARDSKISHIARQLSWIGDIRVQQCAFHPNGVQRILMISPQIFTVLRISPEGNQHILAMTNITSRICQARIPLSDLGMEEKHWYDLVSKRGWIAKNRELDVTLQPYDICWLIPFSELEKMIEP